jgi:hypothetical protein
LIINPFRRRRERLARECRELEQLAFQRALARWQRAEMIRAAQERYADRVGIDW